MRFFVSFGGKGARILEVEVMFCCWCGWGGGPQSVVGNYALLAALLHSNYSNFSTSLCSSLRWHDWGSGRSPGYVR